MFLSYSNVLIVIWSGRQDPDVCKGLYDAAIAVANQTGVGKVAAVSIIQPGITPPTPKAREALARLINDEVRVVHRSALVYPNDGFLASIVRSIALGLMQRSSRRQSHQVFQRLDKAFDWITDGLPTINDRPIPTDVVLRMLESHLVPLSSKVA